MRGDLQQMQPRARAIVRAGAIAEHVDTQACACRACQIRGAVDTWSGSEGASSLSAGYRPVPGVSGVAFCRSRIAAIAAARSSVAAAAVGAWARALPLMPATRSPERASRNDEQPAVDPVSHADILAASDIDRTTNCTQRRPGICHASIWLMPPDRFGVSPHRRPLPRLPDAPGGLGSSQWFTRYRSAFRFRAASVASACVAAASRIRRANGRRRTGSQELEEVVVTAERREVNLQDVPASATVLTAEMLAAKGVDNVIEIQTVAPSVAINTYNRSTFINIRGVGIAQSAPTSNPGVAYYVDGMFIPHEQFIAQILLRHRVDRGVARAAGHADRPELDRRCHLRTHTGAAMSMASPDTSTRQRPTRTGIARRRPSICPRARSSPCASRACTTSAAASRDNIGPSPSDPGSGRDTGGTCRVPLHADRRR